MTHVSRALQSHDQSGEGINFGSHNTFLTTQGHGGTPRMSDQLRDNKNMKDDTHHSLIHSNKADMKTMIVMAK